MLNRVRKTDYNVEATFTYPKKRNNLKRKIYVIRKHIKIGPDTQDNNYSWRVKNNKKNWVHWSTYFQFICLWNRDSSLSNNNSHYIHVNVCIYNTFSSEEIACEVSVSAYIMWNECTLHNVVRGRFISRWMQYYCRFHNSEYNLSMIWRSAIG